MEIKAVSDGFRRLPARIDQASSVPETHALRSDADKCSAGLSDWNHGIDIPLVGDIVQVRASLCRTSPIYRKFCSVRGWSVA